MKVSIIDWIIKKLKRCLAIVEDGDTASQTIAAGKYVVWKGNMCTADSQISSGTTLATSGGGKNLTALTEGVANALNGNVASLQTNEILFTYTDSFRNDVGRELPFSKNIGDYGYIRITLYRSSVASSTIAVAILPIISSTVFIPIAFGSSITINVRFSISSNKLQIIERSGTDELNVRNITWVK